MWLLEHKLQLLLAAPAVVGVVVADAVVAEVTAARQLAARRQVQQLLRRAQRRWPEQLQPVAAVDAAVTVAVAGAVEMAARPILILFRRCEVRQPNPGFRSNPGPRRSTIT